MTLRDWGCDGMLCFLCTFDDDVIIHLKGVCNGEEKLDTEYVFVTDLVQVFFLVALNGWLLTTLGLLWKESILHLSLIQSIWKIIQREVFLFIAEKLPVFFYVSNVFIKTDHCSYSPLIQIKRRIWVNICKLNILRSYFFSLVNMLTYELIFLDSKWDLHVLRLGGKDLYCVEPVWKSMVNEECFRYHKIVVGLVK